LFCFAYKGNKKFAKPSDFMQYYPPDAQKCLPNVQKCLLNDRGLLFFVSYLCT